MNNEQSVQQTEEGYISYQSRMEHLLSEKDADILAKESALEMARGEIKHYLAEIQQLKEEVRSIKFINDNLKSNLAFVKGQVHHTGWVSVAGGVDLENDELCLIVTSGKTQPSQFRNGNFYRYPNHIDGDRCGSYYFSTETVTHYMPLPSPPSAGEQPKENDKI